MMVDEDEAVQKFSRSETTTFPIGIDRGLLFKQAHNKVVE